MAEVLRMIALTEATGQEDWQVERQTYELPMDIGFEKIELMLDEIGAEPVEDSEASSEQRAVRLVSATGHGTSRVVSSARSYKMPTGTGFEEIKLLLEEIGAEERSEGLGALVEPNA